MTRATAAAEITIAEWLASNAAPASEPTSCSCVIDVTEATTCSASAQSWPEFLSGPGSAPLAPMTKIAPSKVLIDIKNQIFNIHAHVYTYAYI